jgi:hypothetical protein
VIQGTYLGILKLLLSLVVKNNPYVVSGELGKRISVESTDFGGRQLSPLLIIFAMTWNIVNPGGYN